MDINEKGHGETLKSIYGHHFYGTVPYSCTMNEKLMKNQFEMNLKGYNWIYPQTTSCSRLARLTRHSNKTIKANKTNPFIELQFYYEHIA